MARPTKTAHIMHRAKEAELSDIRVQRLGDRYRELTVRTNSQAVADVIESGKILSEGRAMVGRKYNRWLEILHVSRDTADRHTSLAEFAHKNPAVIERWAKLGPSKLYRLVRLSPEERRRILAQPGIDLMNDEQFAAQLPKKEQPEGVTGNQIGHGLSESVKAMWNRLGRVELPPIDDPAVRRRLRDQLLAVAERARTIAATLR